MTWLHVSLTLSVWNSNSPLVWESGLPFDEFFKDEILRNIPNHSRRTEKYLDDQPLP